MFRNGEYALEYVVTSKRSHPVQFRVCDRYRTDDSPRDDSSENGEDGYTAVDTTWWLEANSELSFRRPVPGSDGDTALPVSACLIDVAPHVTVVESDVTLLSNGTSEPNADDPVVLAALPAYNEAAAIGDVVASAKRYADAVLVVDDGSDDGTRTIAWEAGAFVISHESNGGYGATLQTIFETGVDVGVDHLVVLDSDGQHDPTDIPRLVARQRSTEADIVIGNRFGERANTQLPAYRRFGLTVINALTNLGLGRKLTDETITDTQSGFRAYSPRALRSLCDDDSIGERMEISTDVLYHAEQREYDIAEVGSTIKYDVEGSSSHNPVVHGYMLVRNLFPMVGRQRPLFVFLSLGAMIVMLVVGVANVLPGNAVLSSGISLGGAVPVPILLLGALVCLGGTFHMIRRFHGQYE